MAVLHKKYEISRLSYNNCFEVFERFNSIHQNDFKKILSRTPGSHYTDVYAR